MSASDLRLFNPDGLASLSWPRALITRPARAAERAPRLEFSTLPEKVRTFSLTRHEAGQYNHPI